MTHLVHSGTFCLVALTMVSFAVGQEGSVTVLSVPPLDHIKKPDDRPSWIDQLPNLESRVHTWSVSSGPKDTFDSCDASLEVLQMGAVQDYIRRLCKSEMVEFYSVDPEWIRKELIVDRYEGELVRGDETLVEKAVLLEFTPSVQGKIRKAYKNLQVRERLGGLGILVFVGLMGLVCSTVILGAVSRRVQVAQSS